MKGWPDFRGNTEEFQASYDFIVFFSRFEKFNFLDNFKCSNLELLSLCVNFQKKKNKQTIFAFTLAVWNFYFCCDWKQQRDALSKCEILKIIILLSYLQVDKFTLTFIRTDSKSKAIQFLEIFWLKLMIFK